MERLLDKSLDYAKSIITIEQEAIDIIKHARKSLLFANGNAWIKRDNELFDVTMGSYDGAEVCELVGLFLLHQMREKFPLLNFGLYRDDGMGSYANLPGPTAERMKKDITKLFHDNDLKITIDMNLSEVDFLDVSLSMKNNTFKPYRKPNSETLYINRLSNHPPNIIKQLPKTIEKRISELSHSKKEFDSVKQDYEAALKNSGFTATLQFEKPVAKKRTRSRKVIYFNPPYNAAVTTNIGRNFLELLDKHFPPHSKYHKLFNRNTVKISYSCSPSIGAIISTHNKTILNSARNQPEPPRCNCRNDCPMDRTGDCRSSNVVYKATVTTDDETTAKEYIGISATEFKLRYANHKQSFVNVTKRDATTLSQHIWRLKENNTPYAIKWCVLAKCAPYACGAKLCNLCITEKYEILKSDPRKTLNKRTEIVGKCRHRAKFKLKKS